MTSPEEHRADTHRTPAEERVDDRFGRLALLGEPIRRALYRYVASRPQAVSREQAAEAVGVAQHTAKFHLDRLESGGLLDASYQRPDDRGGPGAGRPAKVYRRSDEEISVSVPERRYEVLSAVMAAAVEAASDSGVDLSGALQRAAETAGRDAVGHGEDVTQALTGVGYEPRVEDGTLILANCPFHRLAREHTGLVCDINLAFVRGLLAAAGDDGFTPRLSPCAGRCCVVLTPGADSAS